MCCSRSLIWERREELAIGVLKLINSLALAGEVQAGPVVVAGEDAVAVAFPTRRDDKVEEAAVMEATVVWYGALLEAVVVAFP